MTRMSHRFRENEIVMALEYVRLLIVAFAPKVTKSLANIKTVLKKLDIESLSSCPISVDVKVMVILCGKQADSSECPCPYCECQAPFIYPCLPNTLGSLSRYYQKYVEAGSKKSTAMNFNNCVNPALLHGDPDQTILELLTFPELHVMTGTTGHIVNQMIKNVEGSQDLIANFMKESNISWCEYQPGTMEGNQARKFLRLSQKLLKKPEYEEHQSSCQSLFFRLYQGSDPV